MKRVGDDGAVCECERCSELSVDFGEQDGLRRRRGAVKLGQPCQRPLIGRRSESKRHAPVSVDSPSWLRSVVREPVSVGGSAEVIRLCSREGYVELRQHHVSSFQSQVDAASRMDLTERPQPQRRESRRACLEALHDHGHRPRYWPPAGRRRQRRRHWSAPPPRRSKAGFPIAGQRRGQRQQIWRREPEIGQRVVDRGQRSNGLGTC